MTAVSHNFAEVAARLIEQARTLGTSYAETRRLERTDPARRWRMSRLLWPLFAKGQP